MTDPVMTRVRVVGAVHLLVSVLRDEIAGEGRDEVEKRLALTRHIKDSLEEHVAQVVHGAEKVWYGADN